MNIAQKIVFVVVEIACLAPLPAFIILVDNAALTASRLAQFVLTICLLLFFGGAFNFMDKLA